MPSVSSTATSMVSGRSAIAARTFGHLAQRRLVAVALGLLGALLERARVGGVDRRVLADQVVLDPLADDEVLEGADRAERQDEREQEAGDDALAQPQGVRV